MKKKNIIIVSSIIVCIAILFAIFYPKEEKAKAVMKEKPVEVLKVEEKSENTYLNYIGTITSNEIKKLGFKSPGKIKKIHVEKGQKITKGMPLITLDTEDLQYSLDGSKAQLDSASAQYKDAVNGATSEEINIAAMDVQKAEDNYKYNLDNYEKYKALYEEDAISKQDIDGIKLKLDMSQSDLNRAREYYASIKSGVREEKKNLLAAQIDAAKADYNYKKNLLEDGVLKSDIDGYVVDIIYKEGELVSSGYPVIVLRGNSQIVNIGVTQKDISKISLGNISNVYADELKTKGTITNIGEMPDDKTRTYNVEITLDEDLFKIGAVTNIDIDLGRHQGIWIPVNSVKSGDQDYVFVIENKVAKKKNIKIEDTKDFHVKVSGLSQGDLLVMEGVDRLISGDTVVIQK